MTTKSRTIKRQLAVGISVATLGVATLFPTAAGASSSGGGYRPSGDQTLKQLNVTRQEATTKQEATAVSIPISAGNVAVSVGKGGAAAGNQKSTAVASNKSETNQSSHQSNKGGNFR